MTSKPQNQSDQQIAGSEADPITVQEPVAGPTVAAPEPSTEHQADLEAVKAESEQWRDRFLRKAAELENFRKRTERERAESATLVKSAVLVEFLPIMDVCERALKSFSEQHNQAGLQSYREGVELLYKQLGD